MQDIVFVSSSSQMSGVEFSTLYLAQALSRADWCPTVVCPSEGDLARQCRAAGVEVAIVSGAHFESTSTRVGTRTVVNPFALARNMGELYQAAQPLANFLQTRQPALVVTKGLPAHFYGGMAARRAHIPCVWHVQDRVSARTGVLYPWTLAAAGRVLAREMIVDAESIARQLAPIVPRQRISVIWNGVDTKKFSPDINGTQVRAEWHVRPDDLLIGIVGRLTPWKGQHVLLRVFSELARDFPRARVVLVGAAMFDTDAYTRELQNEVERLGLGDRVLFAGFRWDLPEVLAALDIVAHTSLEKDSSPLAVVSAMAAGKAMVCTRVDGTAELFDDGKDGLLIPPGDVHALAETLRVLLADADLRLRLGQAARVKAKRELSIEHFARACEQVLTRALYSNDRTRFVRA